MITNRITAGPGGPPGIAFLFCWSGCTSMKIRLGLQTEGKSGEKRRLEQPQNCSKRGGR